MTTDGDHQWETTDGTAGLKRLGTGHLARAGSWVLLLLNCCCCCRVGEPCLLMGHAGDHRGTSRGATAEDKKASTLLSLLPCRSLLLLSSCVWSSWWPRWTNLWCPEGDRAHEKRGKRGGGKAQANAAAVSRLSCSCCSS